MVPALLFCGPAAVLATSHGSDTPAETGGEAVAGDESEGHGEEAGLVSSGKWWDFVKRTVNFVLLAAILVYLLRKPLGNFFGGRRVDIAKSLEEFEKKKAEAEAKFGELEAKLAEIKAEREKVVADYVKEGEEERAKIVANAREMAERMKKQAQVAIEREIKSAKQELIREIAELSSAMAEEMVRKNINDDDQVRLVKEYLEKVVRN
jgi:F-type H+-transporting ATPase subunit b